MCIWENLEGPWSCWNKDAVDRWLDELSEEVDINGIIKPTNEDQQIVDMVNQPLIFYTTPAN